MASRMVAPDGQGSCGASLDSRGTLAAQERAGLWRVRFRFRSGPAVPSRVRPRLRSASARKEALGDIGEKLTAQ